MENRPVRGTVEFRHVTFAYPGADEPILKDISFESPFGRSYGDHPEERDGENQVY